MKRKFESIFTDRLGAWALNTPKGAFTAGVAATFLAFMYASILWSAYEAFGIFGAVGTVLMWVIIFLFASGMLLSKVPWVHERVSTIVATLYLSGEDEEHVDRNIITIRELARDHKLKVIHEQTMRGEEVPPDLRHMKHRCISVRGNIRKMKAFNTSANQYLSGTGIHIFTGGDAAHEIEGEDT